jgi:hypothetical protein
MIAMNHHMTPPKRSLDGNAKRLMYWRGQFSLATGDKGPFWSYSWHYWCNLKYTPHVLKRGAL